MTQNKKCDIINTGDGGMVIVVVLILVICLVVVMAKTISGFKDNKK